MSRASYTAAAAVIGAGGKFHHPVEDLSWEKFRSQGDKVSARR